MKKGRETNPRVHGLAFAIFIVVTFFGCGETARFSSDEVVADADPERLYSLETGVPVCWEIDYPIEDFLSKAGFGFGCYYGTWHLGVDTRPAETPYNTPVYAPCDCIVRMSDAYSLGGYGSDHPDYYWQGYAIVCESQTPDGERFTMLQGHVQAGSDVYDEAAERGLAPVGTVLERGDYMGRLDHFWHIVEGGGGISQTDWPHDHFGIREGAFDSTRPGDYVLGRTLNGWITDGDDATRNTPYGECRNYHEDWVNPIHFIQSYNYQACWHPPGTLIKTPDNPDVYLRVGDNEIQWITDEDVFHTNGWRDEFIVLVSDDEIALYDRGPNISAEGSLEAYIDVVGQVWLVSGWPWEGDRYRQRVREQNWQSVLASWGLTEYQYWGAELVYDSSTEIYYDFNYPIRSLGVPFRDGALIKQEYEPTVYVMIDGVAVPIISGQTFEQAGYEWSEVVEITAGLEHNSRDIGDCYDPSGLCLRRDDIFQCGGSGGTEGGGSPDPVPEEVCDGADNDADTIIDEGFACRAGASETCATSCGSTGVRYCDSTCVWAACLPPDESCGDGVDNNCDGRVDEGCSSPPPDDDELVIRYAIGSSGGIELWGWSGYAGGGTVFGWSMLADASGASVLEYRAPQPAASFIEFNFELTGVAGADWGCERPAHDVYGAVTATWSGASLSVITIDNGYGGCNFRVEIP